MNNECEGIHTVECPYCRKTFIPLQPRDYDLIEDEEDRLAGMKSPPFPLSDQTPDQTGTVQTSEGCLRV